MTGSLLERGIRAAQAGQREVARAILAQVVQRDPSNEAAWLWLAAVVEDDWHKLYCLRRVQRLNPHNPTAARGVKALAAWLETPRPKALSVSLPDESPPAKTAVSLAPSWKTIGGVLAFVAQRLAFGALVLLSIIYLSYLGLDMASGTEFGPATGHALSKTVAYVGHLARGDLGMTTAGSDTWAPRPVSEVIAERFPRSLGLLGVSLLFASLVGSCLGILAAQGRSRRSLGIILSTLVGISVPSFFAAFLLQWGVTTYARRVGRALLPVGGFGWDNRLILPALVLAARPIAQITRIAFVSVREVLGQDYVRTAYGKGLRRVRIVAVHVMRNAAIPILTTIGVSLRFALSSLPVVELYFSWPGVGFTLLKGIARQDGNLTVALTLCLGTLFILVNLILELSYRFIDPRLLETPPHIASGERQKPLEIIRSTVDTLLGAMTDNVITNWFRRRHSRGGLVPPRAAEAHDLAQADSESVSTSRAGRKSVLPAVLTNSPLVAGGLLILGLIAIVFLGPELSPNSPYRTQGLVQIDGEWTSPPFAPNETYLWGTDALGRGIASLILSGAQQTLMLAALAVAARSVVGVLLGAVAGWTQGSYLDRFLLGLAEVIASFPTLLLTMILILALGIRRGTLPFIIALCFVGWGEIMQFVRGQVIVIRPQPYIENAVAIGARTARIITRHVLPHLFSALISILALEMGAVLTLLGELGFISIFIGGGIVAAPIPGRRILYSDVPEWGALLSDLRYLARSYPWTALYPMLAFTVSILSFNLFGEGIRRLLEQGSLVINRLVNRYTVGLALVATVGLIWLSSHSGAIAFYQQHAREFDGERALGHATALTGPQMDERALGTPGMDRAAQYVAEEFESLGLQAVGQEGTFFQERFHSFERLEAVPTLTIEDSGPDPVYGRDYAAYPGPETMIGEAQGAVRFIGLGRQGRVEHGFWRPVYAELDRADFSEEILLVLSGREAEALSFVPKAGMLVIADDPALLGQRFTIGGRRLLQRRSAPWLWISTELADRLLAGTGHTVAGLQEECTDLAVEEVLQLSLAVQASFAVEGTLEEKWPVRHVLGYLPGTHSYDFCADCLGKQLIVVMAQYDTPPRCPDGVACPAANDDPSGVAVMLEAIRVMQETEYQPYKTFLFIVYSGEGLEGGEYVYDPDVARFMQARAGLSRHELEAIVQLHLIGGSSSDRLQVSASGSLRLAKLLERAAKQVGADTVRADEAIDVSVIYEEGSSFDDGGQDAPVARLFWEAGDGRAGMPEDVLPNLSAADLEKVGRTLALSLMVLGRETEY